MRAALPTTTVLQNRYCLMSVLGQGGFGRTYLAEDRQRFNELCALKELIPIEGDPYALQKSQELFQREAQTLYQIQHPQVPQFRAAFEQDQRFFLVQDYVDGQTYRALLDQRRSQGQAFSEAEVTQLLHQILPVLGHLHSKSIVHRDISPDNIILRSRDRLPVLIDFGVVKELATRFQTPGAATPQHTTVGKLGYAPSEQMQTGRAYPNSDLYSLAVTAVVLLTGRDPQDLYDDTTLTWYWQRWASVSPGFANVINKMLSFQPNARFQSVDEVLQALQSGAIGQPAYTSPSNAPAYPQAPAQPPYATQTPNQPDLSQMRTMAVGRRPEGSVPAAREIGNNIQPQRTLWDDPWAIGLIGTGLVVLTGIGSWWAVRTVMNPAPEPSPTVSASVKTPTPTPSPTVSATPSPSPTPTPSPVNVQEQLTLTPDNKLTKKGFLRENQTLTYVIPGQQGQQLSAVLNAEGVLMTVLDAFGQPLDQAKRVSLWQGTLPQTGDYSIQLSPVKGLSKAEYQVDFTLKNPATPSPSPTDTATPTPSPTIQTETLSIPSGQTQTSVRDRTTPAVIRRYVVRAGADQVMTVVARSGGVTLDIRTPDGQLFEGASKVMNWEAKLPSNGDYLIDVVADRETDYEVMVNVRN